MDKLYIAEMIDIRLTALQNAVNNKNSSLIKDMLANLGAVVKEYSNEILSSLRESNDPS